MSDERTYLDYNATAPLRLEARAAMLAAMDLAGNASSVHAEGRAARAVVEAAREEVAALVAVRPEQVVFTSGATEANNWALRAGWSTILLTGIEHESVLAPAHASGAHVIDIGCRADGRIDNEAATDQIRRVGQALRATQRPRVVPAALGRTPLDPTYALVSLQSANSETGVIQPVAAVAEAARSHGVLVHSDAVQTAGRIAVDFNGLGLDLMSLSAHKLGGPKGVGALVLRDGLEPAPLMVGGGQERRRRAGTENVAAIAGFGAAAAAARTGLADTIRIAALRDELEAGVRETTPSAVIIGQGVERLPNTSCIALAGEAAAMQLIKLDLAGIAVSAGSACSSGRIGGSHVLTAMRLDKTLADSAIRVSLGWATTQRDIDRFLAAWAAIHRAGARQARALEILAGE